MTLERILEPEVMDTPEEARQYEAMDHSEVNRSFVADLLAAESEPGDVLDLGAGTALIPIALCQQCEQCRVMAADLSVHMLDLARYNIEIEGLTHCIQLECIDVKKTPFADGYFTTVMSNGVLHHWPDPLAALRESLRVLAPGGLIFHRDLLRPDSDARLQELVETCAGQESETAREMFARSLRASLTLEEIQDVVSQLGFEPARVAATSQRHWTWSARKSQESTS